MRGTPLIAPLRQPGTKQRWMVWWVGRGREPWERSEAGGGEAWTLSSSNVVTPPFIPSEAPPWDSRPVSGAGVVHYHSLHRPRSVPTALGPAPLVTNGFVEISTLLIHSAPKQKSNEWMHLSPFYTRMHGEWLRYAKSTSQFHWRFLLIRDVRGFQVNPLCRHDITRSDRQIGNTSYILKLNIYGYRFILIVWAIITVMRM